MTWMYRMHGVPVPVPGDINQMHESSSLMVCLAKPDVRHNKPDCQSTAQGHIHEDNLAQDL